MIELKKLIKNLRELGWKEFRRRWGEGIQRITPIQLAKTEMIAMVGAMLGLIVAIFIFIFIHNQFWIIAVIMFFNLILQGAGLIGKIQQYKSLKEFEFQLVEEFMEEKE